MFDFEILQLESHTLPPPIPFPLARWDLALKLPEAGRRLEGRRHKSYFGKEWTSRGGGRRRKIS